MQIDSDPRCPSVPRLAAPAGSARRPATRLGSPSAPRHTLGRSGAYTVHMVGRLGFHWRSVRTVHRLALRLQTRIYFRLFRLGGEAQSLTENVPTRRRRTHGRLGTDVGCQRARSDQWILAKAP